MSTLTTGYRVTNFSPFIARLRLLAFGMLLVMLAGCASSQKSSDTAESQSRRAAESNTSLGLEYMNRGQYEVALGKLKKAINEDSDYAPAHTVIAILYERVGETELAGKHYQEAYEADPTDGDVNNNYGVYICQHRNVKQALDHFQKALADPFYATPAVALTNAGSCALGSNDMQAAEDYLRRALKFEPEFPDALMNMARLNFENRNYLSSRAFMQRYEAVAQHDPESLLLAFKIETASGDNRAANRYKLALESGFPDSDQTAEVRRISGK
jgi:type IV pilus assembly protein PilF